MTSDKDKDKVGVGVGVGNGERGRRRQLRLHSFRLFIDHLSSLELTGFMEFLFRENLQFIPRRLLLFSLL